MAAESWENTEVKALKSLLMHMNQIPGRLLTLPNLGNFSQGVRIHILSIAWLFCTCVTFHILKIKGTVEILSRDLFVIISMLYCFCGLFVFFFFFNDEQNVLFSSFLFCSQK